MTRGSSSRGASRKGPPLAVRMHAPHAPEVLAAQALEDGAELAVDGQDPAAARARERDQVLAGDHQRLLVGERQLAAALEHGHRGRQTPAPRPRRARRCRSRARGTAPRAPPAREKSAIPGQLGGRRCAAAASARATARGRNSRAWASERLPARAGGQAHDAEALPPGAHDVQGLGADRAGAAEDQEGFHAGRSSGPGDRSRGDCPGGAGAVSLGPSDGRGNAGPLPGRGVQRAAPAAIRGPRGDESSERGSPPSKTLPVVRRAARARNRRGARAPVLLVLHLRALREPGQRGRRAGRGRRGPRAAGAPARSSRTAAIGPCRPATRTSTRSPRRPPCARSARKPAWRSSRSSSSTWSSFPAASAGRPT